MFLTTFIVYNVFVPIYDGRHCFLLIASKWTNLKENNIPSIYPVILALRNKR